MVNKIYVPDNYMVIRLKALEIMLHNGLSRMVDPFQTILANPFNTPLDQHHHILLKQFTRIFNFRLVCRILYPLYLIQLLISLSLALMKYVSTLSIHTLPV